MTIPDYQTLMLPVLKKAAQAPIRVPEIEGNLADEFGLSQAERDELLPSGRQKILHNRIHWAKFYLSKAGLIETPERGRFIATEAGRKLLGKNPDKIDLGVLLQYPRFQEFHDGSPNIADIDEKASAASSGVGACSKTPEEQIEAAFVALQSALRADLL